MANITGTPNSETLSGTVDDDIIQGLAGNDIIYGNGGNDVIDGGADKDEMYGGPGNDTFEFLYAQDVKTGELIDGGVDHDTVLLKNANTFDMRRVDFRSIEEIAFGSSGAVFLSAEEIGGTNGLASNLLVSGYDATNYRESISIYMNLATSVDISGWQFQNWGGQGEFIYFFGDANDEIMVGSSGTDIFDGLSGRDEMYGGDGDDIIRYVLSTTAAGDIVDGGNGNDTLELRPLPTFSAHTFDLRGVDFRSIELMKFYAPGEITVILDAAEIGGSNGLASNLEVLGFTNTDNETIEIVMGAATEVDISGWQFQNWGSQGETIFIRGDDDAETISGSSQNDIIAASGGDDILRGGNGADDISGQDGHDTLRGGGDDSADGLWGGAGNDKIWGGGGNDQIGGGIGHDTILGQTGNDTIWGGSGSDWIQGGYGNDNIQGGNDADNIAAGPGDDILRGGADNAADQLWGGDGNDRIWGGGGNDQMGGGTGHDILYGQLGNDTMWGGDGNDTMEGGLGNDTLNGGRGLDWLYGNGGADTFHYRKGHDTDRIKDFEDDIDKLDLSSWGFADVNQALGYATDTNGHVKFDFTSVAGAGVNDILWVENITKGALTNDILV